MEREDEGSGGEGESRESNRRALLSGLGRWGYFFRRGGMIVVGNMGGAGRGSSVDCRCSIRRSGPKLVGL